MDREIVLMAKPNCLFLDLFFLFVLVITLLVGFNLKFKLRDLANLHAKI
jgi:hypothetical protein